MQPALTRTANPRYACYDGRGIARETLFDYLSPILLAHPGKPHYTHDNRGVAQLVAHRVWDAGVGGSSPLTPTQGRNALISIFFTRALRFQLLKPSGDRSIKVDMARLNYDGVVEAIRYDHQGQVQLVRVYIRHGPTWSDVVLFDRQSFVEQLKSGKRFVVGERIPLLAGTFKTTKDLSLIGHNGNYIIVTGDTKADKDSLPDVPVF